MRLRRSLPALAIILFLLLPGRPLATESPGEAALASQGTPRALDTQSSAEVLSQNITIVLHPDTNGISADAEVLVRANIYLSELVFQLLDTLEVTGLEAGGGSLDFSREGSRLTVRLPGRIPPNATVALNISYGGEVRVYEGGLRDDYVGPEGAYVKGSTAWYLHHHTSDWADYRLKICCPAGWTAVADGELAEVERSTLWANYTWVTDRPCIRPAFAAANYTSTSLPWNGVNITVYTYPHHGASAPAHLQEAAAILSHHSALLGPYDRRSLKIVETDHQTYDGYACSGMVMLKPLAFAGTGCDFKLLGHELGHMWFPYKTGYTGWGYQWIWEGFAEYLLCMYEMSQYGTKTRLESDRDSFAAVHDSPEEKPVRSTTWGDALTFPVLYAKGAYILHMLRGLMGDASFNATLREFVEENEYGWASADRFISKAKHRCPLPMDAFFDQWLNTTKDLDIALPAAREYENGTGFYLELEPVNLLSARARVDIGLEYEDGSRETIRAGWDGVASRVSLSAGQRVPRVVLDPEGWLLDVNLSNQEATPLPAGRIYELEALSLSFNASPAEGEVLHIEAGVLNNCSYDVKGVRVDFFVDRTPLSSEFINISRGEMHVMKTVWVALEGRHELGFVVDAGDDIKEWNEGNNALYLWVSVGPPPPRLDLQAGELIVQPPSPVEGEVVSVRAIIRNAGEAELPNASAALELDGEVLRRWEGLRLPVGYGMELRTTLSLPRGWHTIMILADPDRAIDELDEGNNRAGVELFVRWPLNISLSFSPENPLTLEPVTFYVNGSAQEYLFDFGDGISTGWRCETRATHTYTKAAVYEIVVRGRVGGYLEESARVFLRVSNRPPELSLFFNDTAPLSLTNVTMTARALDPDGEVRGVFWRLGDGSTARGERVVHSYSRPGSYEISCTATDDHGDNTSVVQRLTVRNRLPEVRWEVAGERAKARAGEKIALRAIARDPDGIVVMLSWNFGDGQSARGELVEHIYPRPGRYLVTLEAEDDFGAQGNFSDWVEVARGEATAGPDPLPLAAGVGAILAAALASIIATIQHRKKKRLEREFFRKP
ncbi:MAG: PKD domain-containing protein [Thermoplasmata archaeon]